MGPPALVTRRLRIRALHRRDAPAIFLYAQDPVVARHVLWDAHRTLEDTQAFLTLVESRYESGIDLEWGIEFEGAVVGTIGFFDHRPDHRRAELGYALGRPWWGRGFMVEAAGAVLGHAFGEIGLHKVVATTRVENVASQRVLERLGFEHEGKFRQHLFVKGRWWDIVSFARIAGDRAGT